MIKRTIEISSAPAHLSVKNRQLIVQPRGTSTSRATSIPCEDIGIVVVDEPSTTWTHRAQALLMECGATIVVCGWDHLPAGLLLPYSGHTEVVSRLRDQVAAGKPLRKRLWQQIVTAKVRQQAAVLGAGTATGRRLLSLARQVRSGDPSNVEAQAAKAYWREWLEGGQCGSRFRRDPDGGPPNNLLNYGYAILRAAVARALVSGGLHPALGIHHHNRSNAFCLADDLMEPLRPMIDARVRSLYLSGSRELDPCVKGALLSSLAESVAWNGQTGPLMVSLHRMTASLAACLRGESKVLEIPAPCGSADTDACGSS